MLIEMLNETEQAEFENKCFAAWLNKIDAIVTYDERREMCVSDWRELYDDGLSYHEAIECGLGIGFLS